MAVIKRSISDGVGVSSGPKSGGSDTSGGGITAKKRSSSGGGAAIPGPEQTTQNQPLANSREAYLEGIRRAREQYQSDSAKSKRAAEQKKAGLGETSTGRYEKGGAVVQETRGNYDALKNLQKQQPGSVIVQNDAGDYILVKGMGLNFSKQSTFEKFNENLAFEGREKYIPTETKTPTGTFFQRGLRDNVGVSGELEGTAWIAQPSEGGGTKYSVFLQDSLGGKKPYQKTRQLFPRELAEMQTKGELPKFFIGPKGVEARRQELASAEQQGFKTEQVLPATFINKEGKEIVTITGKSKETEFQIFQTEKKPTVIIQSGKVEANKIFPFPLEAPKKEITITEAAKQEYVNMGIDIVLGPGQLGLGVPQQTKAIKEELLQYRKETSVDKLFNPSKISEINPKSAEFIGSMIAFGSTFLIGSRAVPLRVKPLSIPVRGGISEKIYSGVKVGYGKYSVYAAGRTSEGQILLGRPNPKSLSLEKYEPPSSRGGFPISEETSGLLTTKPYLTELVRQKKFTLEDIGYIQNVKRGLEITRKIPDVIIRKDIGKAPVQSLMAGKETKRAEELIISKQKKGTLPPAKGSLIQQYYVTKDYLRRSRDLDFQLSGKRQEQRGRETVKSFETELQKVAERNRIFEAKDLTLKVTDEGKENKVMELLTKENAGKDYPYTNPTQVFGMKVPSKSVKPGKIKTLTYRFQGIRKGSSITESTPEGPRPAKGREKDIFDFVGYTTTKAEQVGGKKGKELGMISSSIKGYAKKKGFWTEQGETTTIFESPKKTPRSEYVSIVLKESKSGIISPSLISSSKPQKESRSIYSTGYPSVASRSVSLSKSISKPITSRPIISRPITSIPITSRPIISQPTTRPTTSRPITSRPVTSKPITSRPIISRPITSRPITSRPITSRPIQPTYYPLIPPIPIVAPPPKKILFALPKKFIPRERKAKEEPGSRADFIGNTRLQQIEGIYSRPETTYGLKKINKLVQRDISGRKPRTTRRKKEYKSISISSKKSIMGSRKIKF